MSRFEYTKIPMRWFPQDIINQYKILNLVDKDGLLYVKIHKGMYGIKKTAHISFEHILQSIKTLWILSTMFQPWYLVPRNAPKNSLFLWTLLGKRH